VRPPRVGRIPLTVAISPVDVSPMPDLDDHYKLSGIVDRIQHTVVPLAEPIFLLAGQLLSAGLARVRCQALDFGDETLPVVSGEGLKFLGS